MNRIKGSISSKLTKAFFIVVILSLLITGISFSIMIRNYIIVETRKNLLQEGEAIAGAFGTLKNVSDLDEEVQKRAKRLSILSNSINVNFAVIDNDNNILYSKYNTSIFNLKLIEKSIIQKVRETNKPETRSVKGVRNFLLAAMPINDNRGNIKAVLLLYTPINGLKAINYSIFRILILSIVISVIIAFIVAYMFAVKISRPINLLRKKTERVSRRDFNIQKVVHTGDEIEALDESFNSMAIAIKEYNESQKRFLQNISHELKTPLMSIQGYAEGIKDGIIGNEDMDKSLNIIINESQRLKKLVDDIIFLTKLESMDDMYNFSSVCLNNIVKDSVDKVKSLILKKNLEIIINEDQNIYCTVDKDRFSQVIINIIGNGVRYADNLININLSKANDEIRIEIENDGDRLTDEEKNNIFKRFYKGKNEGQTGLGMAIAYTIIDKHGGGIYVEDSRLGGPKFIIVLPCKNTLT